MNTTKTPGRIHPLVAAAAVSVTLVSLIGVAAITGILPASHSRNPDTPVAEQNVAQDKNSYPAGQAPVAALADNASEVHHTGAQHPARTHHSSTYQEGDTVVAEAPETCHSCGRVESVNVIKHKAQGSGVGVVTGALLGGLLGNQVGGGNGRKLATVAGAVGGGYAGNEVEKNVRASTSYDVRVRMNDGSVRDFSYGSQPGWAPGDHVRVVDGHLTAQG